MTGSNKRKAYTSGGLRNVSSKERKGAKDEAHRRLRRNGKSALRRGDEVPERVALGWLD